VTYISNTANIFSCNSVNKAATRHAGPYKEPRRNLWLLGGGGWPCPLHPPANVEERVAWEEETSGTADLYIYTPDGGAGRRNFAPVACWTPARPQLEAAWRLLDCVELDFSLSIDSFL
jgi:hypothetical protein